MIVSELNNVVLNLEFTYCIGQSLAFGIGGQLSGLATGGGGAGSPNGLFEHVRIIQDSNKQDIKRLSSAHRS